MRITAHLSRLALGALVAVAVPSTAHAQFGKALKRAAQDAAARGAERKVQQAAGTSAGNAADDATSRCAAPTFDRTTLELTSERVDRLVTALASESQTPEGAKRKALVSQREAAEARLQELENDEALRQAQESERQWKSCRNDGFREILEARMEKEGSGLSAKYMQALRTHNERIVAANAKGDTAKANALQDSTWVVLTTVVAPTAADSAAVGKKCGTPPRTSRRVAERDSLRVAVREMGDEIRDLDERNEDRMLAAVGMTATQLAMARERVTTFIHSSGRPCGFSKAEQDAIAARRADLEKLL